MGDSSGEPMRSLWARLWDAAVEELGPLLTRRVLGDLASNLPAPAFANTRTALYRAAGVRIGRFSRIQGSMRLSGRGQVCPLLSIGDYTLITGGLHVDLGAPVSIGMGVRIGHDVSLLTISHAVGSVELRAGTSFAAGIVIEDGAWLASRCTVLAGVRIGRGAIVAAGSVVTRDVPPNVLVAGVPARVLRELPVEPSS